MMIELNLAIRCRQVHKVFVRTQTKQSSILVYLSVPRFIIQKFTMPFYYLLPYQLLRVYIHVKHLG